MTAVDYVPKRVEIVAERRRYIPHVVAEERADEMWEAWIEFHPEDGGPILVTDRESTQPNRTAVEYWMQGLEPIYFEGAFTRAAERSLPRR
jgi:hypothetical protein